MNKQQIIDLWRISFNDTEEFMRLYFDRIYNEENALVIEKDGQVVSALQMIPYTMTWCGTEISIAYISGACTLPSMRGQGLMRQLIQEAFEEMKRRDIAITALIPADPWLFDYYKGLGYTETFYYTEETYIRPDQTVWEPNLTVVPPEVPSTDLLYAYFNRKLRERPNCVLHTQDDFITILRDMQLEDGQVLTALDDKEQPVGMVFLFPSDEDCAIPDAEKAVYIKELLYDTDSIANLLLQEATLQHNVKKAKYRIPPSTPDTLPLGMARVIDTHRLIHHWASWHRHSPVSVKEMEEMDIQTLTRHLMGYPQRLSYMSLMLD